MVNGNNGQNSNNSQGNDANTTTSGGAPGIRIDETTFGNGGQGESTGSVQADRIFYEGGKDGKSSAVKVILHK